ncbi:S41 family peptidase [Parabacteroides sp. OttesenSCG-928-G21]|nr:S41 family peptidase [Parabacteroides sp. OttesenSCG-928-G21]
MRRGLVIIYSLLFIFLLGSCEKGEMNRTPRENFESLWRIIDENYCYFDYKDVDWNEVYDRYSRQVSDTLDQYELFDLLGKMLAELKDGHTNLISSFNISRYWKWYEDYPANFSSDIKKKYLGENYRIAGGMEYTKLKEDQIGYMYYGSFSSGIGDTNLDHILYFFKDCKGLIIDIRDNGGGSLAYSDRIAARFLNEKILTGYIQHKTGKGHNDFSDPYPVYLEPSSRLKWLRPVVILTNRHCYSAANDFVQKMKLLPQVVIIGDQTGGGSGFPFNSELPNGWGIRFSSSPMLDVDKQHTEFGIEPDIYVSMTAEDMQKDEDTIIEAAIANLISRSEQK